MSQQQTVLTLEQMISSMSPEGQMTLAKIGATWKEYAGAFGSLVYNSIIIKMLKQDRPWSVNKLTFQGQGRNGVVYTLLPMLKTYHLVEEVEGMRYSRYMLNNIGKEVMRVMMYTCTVCDQSRECQKCWKGLDYHKDDEGRMQSYECGRAIRYGAEHKIDECRHCNEFGHQLCYTCNGENKCQYCVSDDEIA